MKMFRMLAPTISNPNVYPEPALPGDSPREVMRFHWESAKECLVLAIVVPALSFALLSIVSIASPSLLPDFVLPLVPVAIGLFLLFLAILMVWMGAWYGSRLESKRMESQQWIKETEAETKKIEAQARLVAATPPVIAEVIRPVPVANPQARTFTSEQAKSEPMPVKPQFWNGTDMPADDLRWFVQLCLKLGRHSRNAILNLPVEERTAPSGKVLNDVVDYDKFIEPLVKYKIIINREQGLTGTWHIKSEEQVFRILGL